MNSSAAIDIQNLSFAYHRQAIINVPRFELKRGESMAVIGPSGCGKTTFMHLTAGLLTPTAGTVTLFGSVLDMMSESARDHFRGKNIGLVFQKLHLLPALDVRENIMLAARLARRTPEIDEVQSLMHDLQIDGLDQRQPSALSHGQAQRVAIARALVHKPGLLIADEPTSALDDSNAQRVLELLQSAAKTSNAALLLVTHDQRIRGQLNHEYNMVRPE